MYSPVNQQQGQLVDGSMVASDADSQHTASKTVGGMRDPWFLVGFLGHIVGVIIIAGVFGPGLVSLFKSGSSSSDSNGSTSNPDTSTGRTGLVLGLFVLAAAVGSIFAAIWIKVMQKFQGRIVKVSVVTNVAVVLLAMIVFFAVGQTGLAVVYLIYGLILCGFVYFCRDRIPMAEATLGSSCQSVIDNSGPIYIAYLIAVVQIVWCAFWAFTIVAVYYAMNQGQWVQNPNYPRYSQQQTIWQANGSTPGQNFAFVYLVFSLYWTSQVLRNISHVTTAGMVAAWWLTPDLARPTVGAFKRACTTSLGSICFGSLLVAIIQLVVFLVRQVRGYGAVCVGCILRVLERIMKWFNKFAFVEVSMYGYTFFEAARAVQQLMAAKFWEILINDSLVTMVFWMGNVLSGVVAAFVCGIWAAAAGVAMYQLVAFIAFWIGLLLSSLFTVVLDSAVATTYVVWAEDPTTMSRNRPEHFNRLAAAAQGKYPQEFQQAFAHVQQQQQGPPPQPGMFAPGSPSSQQQQQAYAYPPQGYAPQGYAPQGYAPQGGYAQQGYAQPVPPGYQGQPGYQQPPQGQYPPQYPQM